MENFIEAIKDFVIVLKDTNCPTSVEYIVKDKFITEHMAIRRMLTDAGTIQIKTRPARHIEQIIPLDRIISGYDGEIPPPVEKIEKPKERKKYATRSGKHGLRTPAGIFKTNSDAARHYKLSSVSISKRCRDDRYEGWYYLTKEGFKE